MAKKVDLRVTKQLKTVLSLLRREQPADRISAASNVDIVGEYAPTFYGFGKHKPGVRPCDLAL